MVYLLRRRFAPILILDQLLRPLQKATKIEKLDKILLCNIAHLGDVVIATSVLPVLREAMPNAQFGFLLSDFSSCVLQDHPEISWLHRVEHWELNRAPLSKIQKIRAYYKTKRIVIEEIKQVGYDVAIDLYPYFPNAVPILWKTGIRNRIGYTSGGFGPLLSHPVKWERKDQHVSSYHFELLKKLPISLDKTHLRYNLPRVSEGMAQKWNLQKGFLLFHMGSGAQEKDWPEDYWRKLAESCDARQIVFTGKGSSEQARITRVSHKLQNTVDLSNQLSWKELCEVVSLAGSVITVDSAVGHIAEAYAIPSIVILMGSANPFHWMPPHAINLVRPSFEVVRSRFAELEDKVSATLIQK